MSPLYEHENDNLKYYKTKIIYLFGKKYTLYFKNSTFLKNKMFYITYLCFYACKKTIQNILLFLLKKFYMLIPIVFITYINLNLLAIFQMYKIQNCLSHGKKTCQELFPECFTEDFQLYINPENALQTCFKNSKKIFIKDFIISFIVLLILIFFMFIFFTFLYEILYEIPKIKMKLNYIKHKILYQIKIYYQSIPIIKDDE